MNRRRVVITGTGILSALGNTGQELYEALLAGRCAVRDGFEGGRRAAPVDLPESVVRAIPRSFRRGMGRAGVFSALAAAAAAKEAGLTEAELTDGRCGCAAGSTMGSPSSIDETYRVSLLEKDRDLPSTQFFKCVSHTTAFNAANYLGIRGSVYSPSAACASGLQAVGLSRDLIAAGTQDIMICGGADEVTGTVCDFFQMVSAAGTGSFPPEQSSRPFDADRTGLICGDGAGMLVLESLEHARARGAEILGEILGYATCGNGSGLGQSDPDGIERCMRLALKDAGITPEQVGFISAHATSTIQGDAAEAEAIRRIFGENGVPVFSAKGALGHTLAASGPLETAMCLCASKAGILPPTLNFTKATDCAGLDLSSEPRRKKGCIFLKNCFAFGGINATLLCTTKERYFV